MTRLCSHHERHCTTRVATSEKWHQRRQAHLRPCAGHVLDPTPRGQYRREAHRSCPCAHTPWPAARRPSCCASIGSHRKDQHHEGEDAGEGEGRRGKGLKTGEGRGSWKVAGSGEPIFKKGVPIEISGRNFPFFLPPLPHFPSLIPSLPSLPSY